MVAGRTHTRGIRRAALLAIVASLAVAACAPNFPGTPPIQPYSGTTKKRVLLIGDSLMVQATGPIYTVLAAHHLPAAVIPRARSGAAVPPGEFAGIDWVRDLPAIMDATRPDFVVAEFVGHGWDAQHPLGSSSWAPWAEANAIRIVDLVQSRGIPIYWVVPPVATFWCDWNNPLLTTGVYKLMANWYRTGLIASRPSVVLVDWRTPISPGETRSQVLRFGKYGNQLVRPNDCMHLTTLGANVAADATVARIRGEWDRPPTTTTTSTTTSTSTTSTSTSTTTTTSP